MMNKAFQIVDLTLNELDSFMGYIESHLSENGENGILFQPLSKDQINTDGDWRSKFESAFDKALGDSGWRKVWVAMDKTGVIIGHADIRSLNQLNTAHRVLLGMGVDRNHRKLGIGQQLLEWVIAYCKNDEGIDWLELEVLSNNTPAVDLYLKHEFELVSQRKDMFRIDGRSYDYTAMTLAVKKSASGVSKNMEED